MEMICPSCQEKNSDETYFCKKCGLNLHLYSIQSKAGLIKKDKKFKITSEISPPTRGKKMVSLIISLIISGFYILSALGWFAAMYMMLSGNMTAPESIHGINIFDHIIRISQVVLILAASIFLILSKRIALKLFLICLLIGLFSFVFVGKWAVTFIGFPFSLLILTLVYGYVYFLNRHGYLQ